MIKYAIVRRPDADFVRGLTTAQLGRPDWQLALRQHAAYVAALRALGIDVTVLPAAPGFPDAPFVEDTAVVTEHGAVITRPGAPERRGEEASIVDVLSPRMPVVRIEDDAATLDGGDVLRVDDRFIIGLTPRTNALGAQLLAKQLQAWGYQTETLAVHRYLHLKTAANYIGQSRLLVTRELAGAAPFAGLQHLLVDDAEEYAANSIFVNGTLLTPAGFPGVRSQLDRLHVPIVTLELSEFQKVDGGLTCLSLLF